MLAALLHCRPSPTVMSWPCDKTSAAHLNGLNGDGWSLLLSQPRPGASRGIDIARGQSMHPEEDVGIYGRSLAFQGQQPALPMR